MEVEWRNGHRSVYPSAFLRSYAYDARRLEEKQRALNEVVGWGRDDVRSQSFLACIHPTMGIRPKMATFSGCL